MSDSSVGTLRGSEVIAFRKRHNLTQEEFANVLGLTKAAIVKWELNQRGVSEPLWRLLCLFDAKPELIRIF